MCNIKDVIWNTFVYEKQTFIIKIFEDVNYNVIITDLANIWQKMYSRKEMLDKIKELNPKLIDNEDSILISEVISLVQNINKCEMTLVQNEKILELKCRIKLDFMGFQFNFDTSLSSNDKFREEITVPLVNTIQNLQTQKDHLCKLLEKKDIEIEQYKYEHGELQRKFVVTEKFDRQKIDGNLSKHACELVLTNNESFIGVLGSNYKKFIPEINIKKEENLIKKPSKVEIPRQIKVVKPKRQRTKRKCE